MSKFKVLFIAENARVFSLLLIASAFNGPESLFVSNKTFCVF